MTLLTIDHDRTRPSEDDRLRSPGSADHVRGIRAAVLAGLRDGGAPSQPAQTPYLHPAQMRRWLAELPWPAEPGFNALRRHHRLMVQRIVEHVVVRPRGKSPMTSPPPSVTSRADIRRESCKLAYRGCW